MSWNNGDRTTWCNAGMLRIRSSCVAAEVDRVTGDGHHSGRNRDTDGDRNQMLQSRPPTLAVDRDYVGGVSSGSQLCSTAAALLERKQADETTKVSGDRWRAALWQIFFVCGQRVLSSVDLACYYRNGC